MFGRFWRKWRQSEYLQMNFKSAMMYLMALPFSSMGLALLLSVLGLPLAWSFAGAATSLIGLFFLWAFADAVAQCKDHFYIKKTDALNNTLTADLQPHLEFFQNNTRALTARTFTFDNEIERTPVGNGTTFWVRRFNSSPGCLCFFSHPDFVLHLSIHGGDVVSGNGSPTRWSIFPPGRAGWHDSFGVLDFNKVTPALVAQVVADTVAALDGHLPDVPADGNLFVPPESLAPNLSGAFAPQLHRLSNACNKMQGLDLPPAVLAAAAAVETTAGQLILLAQHHPPHGPHADHLQDFLMPRLTEIFATMPPLHGDHAAAGVLEEPLAGLADAFAQTAGALRLAHAEKLRASAQLELDLVQLLDRGAQTAPTDALPLAQKAT